jgi:RNA polymerase sigma-70 factor, ECF subfamily
MGTSPPLQAREAPWVDTHAGNALVQSGQGYHWPTTPDQDTPSCMAEPHRPADSSQASGVANQREAESSFALLLRARDGDGSARDELFARYLPRLQRWAHGRLPTWARGAVDTGDIVQDTLLQVFQKIATFQPQHEGALFSYLRHALMNRIRDEIRRAQRRGPTESLDSEKPDLEPSPLERAIGQQALENYEAALQRLRPGDREAIILRIELGLSVPEVAQALCKPSVAAAHMAISRALVRLTKEMSHGS